jgi:hypothetical protein
MEPKVFFDSVLNYFQSNPCTTFTKDELMPILNKISETSVLQKT